jgi:hypothetical protein
MDTIRSNVSIPPRQLAEMANANANAGSSCDRDLTSHDVKSHLRG